MRRSTTGVEGQSRSKRKSIQEHVPDLCFRSRLPLTARSAARQPTPALGPVSPRLRVEGLSRALRLPPCNNVFKRSYSRMFIQVMRFLTASIAIALGLTQTPPPSPPITLRDVASSSGITFRLENHPTPAKRLIETMPGGLAAFDYNNDGLADLFFTNGATATGGSGQAASRY